MILWHLCTHAIQNIARYSTCSDKRTHPQYSNSYIQIVFYSLHYCIDKRQTTQHVVGIAISDHFPPNLIDLAVTTMVQYFAIKCTKAREQNFWRLFNSYSKALLSIVYCHLNCCTACFIYYT